MKSDATQAVAALLRAKRAVWSEFLAAPAGPDRQARFDAWNSLNHAIRLVQRSHGEARKQPASAIITERLRESAG